MQISLNWLNDYVDLTGLKTEEVSAAFTSIGLEIEGTEAKAAFSSDVVVGKVLSAVKHPNADTLRCCKVDVGDGAEPLEIVCGAPNAREGLFVAVAKVGAVLPGDFKIKKSKIRGENSSGMLCSADELGISKDAEGIIELKDGSPLGVSVGKLLGLEDAILTVNVTPNRADCLGYIGLARDLAAKLKRPLKEPKSAPKKSETLTTATQVEVRVADSELCPRFVALYVKNVGVVPSPAWMQKRLEASGQRPINLVVDATNYALLEFGQPVHAYDERKIRGKVIEVRSATAGETLTTLDGAKRVLEEGDLVIADAEGAIGLAGIMGGADSEVKSDTKNVIIEVAAFAPRRIRKTARRLSLHTEASHRFERGIDIERLSTVAFRVAQLIADHAPEVEIAKEAIDCAPVERTPRPVALRLEQAQRLLALPKLTRDEAVEILTGLQFRLLDETVAGRMVFEVPSWRGDVEREVDLIEEIARLYGFDKIPMSLPVMSIRPNVEDEFIEFQEKARLALAATGYRETISFPFLGEDALSALGLGEGHPLRPTVQLANPLQETVPWMRTFLVPNLLGALLANRRHGARGARLFEAGRGYFDFAAKPVDAAQFPTWKHLARPARHIGPRARQDQGRLTERHWLAAVLDQPYREKSWDAPNEARAAFYHGKAALQSLLKAFAIEGAQMARPGAADFPFLHPGAAAVLSLGGRTAGYVGELHPRAAAALGFGEAVPVVLEVDLEILFDVRGKGLKVSSEIRRFPPVTRDLAILVDRALTHEAVTKAIKQFKKKKNLRDAALFDVFAESDKLPAGKKSLAYAFSFQSNERTLIDQEVEQEMEALVAWLGESCGAVRR